MKLPKTYMVHALWSLMLFADTAIADLTLMAKIDKLLVWDEGGLIYVYPDKPITPLAGTAGETCHGSWGNYTSFAIDRAAAPHYMSLLTSAYVMKEPVYLILYDDCIDQSVSLTLKYVQHVGS